MAYRETQSIRDIYVCNRLYMRVIACLFFRQPFATNTRAGVYFDCRFVWEGGLTVDIEPCFCSNIPSLINDMIVDSTGISRDWWHVECRKCKARQAQRYEKADDAVNAWNRDILNCKEQSKRQYGYIQSAMMRMPIVQPMEAGQ